MPWGNGREEMPFSLSMRAPEGSTDSTGLRSRAGIWLTLIAVTGCSQMHHRRGEILPRTHSQEENVCGILSIWEKR